ncbi:hypothetical protein ABK040_015691 [Willaertia magna]
MENQLREDFITNVEPNYRQKYTTFFSKEYQKVSNSGKVLVFDLSFPLDKLPCYRNDGPSANEMLSVICDVLEEIKKDSKKQKYLNNFYTKKVIEFVYSSNKGERGSLDLMQDMKKEMLLVCEDDPKYSILLTQGMLFECHSLLMEGCINNNGQLRTKSAFTIRENNQIHGYVDPKLVENRCSGLIDFYNSIVDRNDLNIEKLFKLAAYLAFNFVDIHPFSDGNGRMCRILANHPLSLLFPFPVSFSTEENNSIYIKAIERCRYSNYHFPEDLTYMLIENAYNSCLEFMETYNSHCAMQVVTFGSVDELEKKGFTVNEQLKNLQVGTTYETEDYQFIRVSNTQKIKRVIELSKKK